MKVTFIEIYNEDITDLLALDESSKNIDERIKKPITLMEDGKGAVFVRGIEEEIVYTADQIYKILDKGSTRKHTADTLLNKQSNRSHSMFTITVQIKECTSEGVELIKCGKLNLVVLAGSENILRSGAREVLYTYTFIQREHPFQWPNEAVILLISTFASVFFPIKNMVAICHYY